MKIYRDIKDLGEIENPVVTVGVFDGVHFGHQKIIKSLVESAKKINGESVVITFFPHPRRVLNPDNNNLKLIITRDEKIDIFRNLGVDHLLEIPFTREFARVSPDVFLRDYIISNIHPRKIIIGYDHHFGKGRKGNIDFLKEMGIKYGFDVEQVKVQDIDEIPVSSTMIREAIKAGDIHLANKYLGYFYSLSGIVVMGNQIGRTLGFPTANIEPEASEKLIPAYGVYAVFVEYGGKIYRGMSNIGIRPTLDIHTLTIEANIFDFGKDIYGEKIRIYFLKHTRNEKKFRDLELLRRRLIIDKIKINKILDDVEPKDLEKVIVFD